MDKAEFLLHHRPCTTNDMCNQLSLSWHFLATSWCCLSEGSISSTSNRVLGIIRGRSKNDGISEKRREVSSNFSLFIQLLRILQNISSFLCYITLVVHTIWSAQRRTVIDFTIRIYLTCKCRTSTWLVFVVHGLSEICSKTAVCDFQIWTAFMRIIFGIGCTYKGTFC